MPCPKETDHRWKLRDDQRSFACVLCDEQRFALLVPQDSRFDVLMAGVEAEVTRIPNTSPSVRNAFAGVLTILRTMREDILRGVSPVAIPPVAKTIQCRIMFDDVFVAMFNIHTIKPLIGRVDEVVLRPIGPIRSSPAGYIAGVCVAYDDWVQVHNSHGGITGKGASSECTHCGSVFYHEKPQ